MLQLTFYTDDLPERFAGVANGPIVRIRPKYRDDAGLHEHEYTHVDQFWVVGAIVAALIAGVASTLGGPLELSIGGLAAHPLLYSLCRPYRLYAEVFAYRAQLRYYSDDRTGVFAGYLATKYGLGVSAEEATKLLRRVS